jgi:hypothetical protein
MPAVASRTVRDILADALLADCGWCWGGWGNPCTDVPPGGMHVARLSRAYRRGLISKADLMAVLEALVVFANDTVVRSEAVAA